MSKYIVKLVCCGRDDGEYSADTWQEANDFRESYTSGVGVDPHGYSAPAHEGHRRAAIITVPKPKATPVTNDGGRDGDSK